MIMTCYVLIDDISLILYLFVYFIYVFILLCDNLNFISYTNWIHDENVMKGCILFPCLFSLCSYQWE